MAFTKRALPMIALVALTACAGTQAPVKALPQSFIDAAMEAALAETIADECRSLRYNQEREDKVLMSYAIQLASAGYTPRDLDAAARRFRTDPKIQVQAIKMMQERRINPGSEASWCAAGKREKSRGTSIGKYLI